MTDEKKPAPRPGVCIPWEQKVKEFPQIKGDPKIVRKAWEEIDDLAYQYVWFCLTLM